MTKKEQDFEVYKGDSITPINVDVQNIGTGEDLTVGTVTWELSRSKHTDALITIQSSDSKMTVNQESFEVELDKSDTDRPPGTYWHQGVYDSGSDEYTLITGEVSILERV